MAANPTFPEQTWAVLHDGQEVVGHVLFTFRIFTQDGDWQGICRELGVPSFGEDPGDALNNVIDATINYLNAIEENGERQRIFREQSIEMQAGAPDEGSRKEEIPPGESVTLLDFGLAVGG